jgi:hypothetical protein
LSRASLFSRFPPSRLVRHLPTGGTKLGLLS